jgi:hypothetical protein
VRWVTGVSEVGGGTVAAPGRVLCDKGGALFWVLALRVVVLCATTEDPPGREMCAAMLYSP